MQQAALPPALPASPSQQEQIASRPNLGLSLAPLTPDIRDQLNLDQKVEGVAVTQVQPDSPADQKGIQPGDVIMSVNQKAVKEPSQVQDAVKKARDAGDQTVLMLLLRVGQQIYEAVPLESGSERPASITPSDHPGTAQATPELWNDPEMGKFFNRFFGEKNNSASNGRDN